MLYSISLWYSFLSQPLLGRLEGKALFKLTTVDIFFLIEMELEVVLSQLFLQDKGERSHLKSGFMFIEPIDKLLHLDNLSFISLPILSG